MWVSYVTIDSNESIPEFWNAFASGGARYFSTYFQNQFEQVKWKAEKNTALGIMEILTFFNSTKQIVYILMTGV